MAAGFAIVTGFIADTIYGHMSEPFQIMETHGSVQIIASSIFIGLYIWRYFRLIPSSHPPIWYLVTGTIATALLLYGSHLGGLLSGHI